MSARLAYVTGALVFAACSAGCTRPAPQASAPAQAAQPTEAPPQSVHAVAVSPSSHALDITIRPVREGSPPKAVDVRVELAAPADAPVFRIGDAINADALNDLIERPILRDDDGLVELSRQVAPGPDGEARILFTGLRVARGKLVLTYRVRAQSVETPGIRFGLRQGGGTIGGSGDGFLILPATSEARDIAIRWDIGHCAFKWQVASALGPNAGPHRIHAAPDALRQAGFYAGGMHTTSFDEGTTHLRLTIIGQVAFDQSVALAYAGRILVAERAAFGDDDATPFYAFMRVLPEMTTKVVGGGNLYGYSSVVGPAAVWNARMRNHIAHELLHHWIGVGLWLRDANGVSGYWLTEGFTTRYARTIALRSGVISAAEYLDEVNQQAAAFYGNPLRGTTNAVIERAIEAGEGDASLGLLPYYKGRVLRRRAGRRDPRAVERKALARRRDARSSRASQDCAPATRRATHSSPRTPFAQPSPRSSARQAPSASMTWFAAAKCRAPDRQRWDPALCDATRSSVSSVATHGCETPACPTSAVASRGRRDRGRPATIRLRRDKLGTSSDSPSAHRVVRFLLTFEVSLSRCLLGGEHTGEGGRDSAGGVPLAPPLRGRPSVAFLHRRHGSPRWRRRVDSCANAAVS